MEFLEGFLVFTLPYQYKIKKLMDKTITWLIRGAVLIVMGGCLLAYLNLEKKPSLIFSQPTIEDLKYKELDKKRANAEFAAKRDSIVYEKFGSTIFVIPQ